MRSRSRVMKGIVCFVSQMYCKLLRMIAICLLLASCSTSIPVSTTVACGTITNPGNEGTGAAEQVGKCFALAYQHCQPASLTYVDPSGITSTFTLKPQTSHCAISETVKTTKNAKKASTFACAQMQAFRGGIGALIFLGCLNGGTITIPVNEAVQ